MEEEALRYAILHQIVHQDTLAVLLKNISCHPTSGIGEPIDGQDALIILLECIRVLCMIRHDRLELAVSSQVSSQQEGKMVLERFEAWGRLLSLVMYKRSGIFLHCRPISSILDWIIFFWPKAQRWDQQGHLAPKMRKKK